MTGQILSPGPPTAPSPRKDGNVQQNPLALAVIIGIAGFVVVWLLVALKRWIDERLELWAIASLCKAVDGLAKAERAFRRLARNDGAAPITDAMKADLADLDARRRRH
jgi:hypothetical protein